MEDIKFENKYTWLSQPLEWEIWFHDELLWSMIDDTYWKTPKEQIFEVCNIDTWKIIDKYIWEFNKILEKIDIKHQKDIKYVEAQNEAYDLAVERWDLHPNITSLMF